MALFEVSADRVGKFAKYLEVLAKILGNDEFAIKVEPDCVVVRGVNSKVKATAVDAKIPACFFKSLSVRNGEPSHTVSFLTRTLVMFLTKILTHNPNHVKFDLRDDCCVVSMMSDGQVMGRFKLGLLEYDTNTLDLDSIDNSEYTHGFRMGLTPFCMAVQNLAVMHQHLVFMVGTGRECDKVVFVCASEAGEEPCSGYLAHTIDLSSNEAVFFNTKQTDSNSNGKKETKTEANTKKEKEEEDSDEEEDLKKEEDDDDDDYENSYTSLVCEIQDLMDFERSFASQPYNMKLLLPMLSLAPLGRVVRCYLRRKFVVKLEIEMLHELGTFIYYVSPVVC